MLWTVVRVPSTTVFGGLAQQHPQASSTSFRHVGSAARIWWSLRIGGACRGGSRP